MQKIRKNRYEMITVAVGEPKICLPIGLDRSKLVNVTKVSDSDGWAKFMDPETGDRYDCREIYERVMQEELRELGL